MKGFNIHFFQIFFIVIITQLIESIDEYLNKLLPFNYHFSIMIAHE